MDLVSFHCPGLFVIVPDFADRVMLKPLGILNCKASLWRFPSREIVSVGLVIVCHFGFCGRRHESFPVLWAKALNAFCFQMTFSLQLSFYFIYKCIVSIFFVACDYFMWFFSYSFSLCVWRNKSFAHIMRHRVKRIFQHLHELDRRTHKFPNQWHHCCSPTIGLR